MEVINNRNAISNVDIIQFMKDGDISSIKNVFDKEKQPFEKHFDDEGFTNWENMVIYTIETAKNLEMTKILINYVEDKDWFVPELIMGFLEDSMKTNNVEALQYFANHHLIKGMKFDDISKNFQCVYGTAKEKGYDDILNYIDNLAKEKPEHNISDIIGLGK